MSLRPRPLCYTHPVSVLLVIIGASCLLWPVLPPVAEAQPPNQQQIQRQRQLQIQRQRQQQQLQQRQQQRQQPPPTPEDWFRLFLAPQDGDDYDRGGDYRNYDPPAADAPPRRRVPSATQVAQMSRDAQRTLLRQALQALDDQLTPMEVGAGWKRYLQTEKLGYHLWNGRGTDLTPSARVKLQQIAERFGSVASSDQYSFLRNAWGFQTIHAALGEYAMSGVDRSRRKVQGSLAPFKSALGRTSTGDSWNKFLKVADVTRIAQGRGGVAPNDMDLLREIAKRFDQASDAEEYPVLNRMRGFSATREHVNQLLQQADQQYANREEWARSELGYLVLDLEALKKGCHDEAEAMETLVMAPQDSSVVDKTRQMIEAIKRDNAKRHREAADRILRLFDHQQRKSEVMESLVLDVASMKKELEAAETLVLAPENSDGRRRAADMLRSIILEQEKDRQDRKRRIEGTIAAVLEENAASGEAGIMQHGPTVMAPDNKGWNADKDNCEEPKFYLMPLPVEDKDEPEYYLHPLPVEKDEPKYYLHPLPVEEEKKKKKKRPKYFLFPLPGGDHDSEAEEVEVLPLGDDEGETEEATVLPPEERVLPLEDEAGEAEVLPLDDDDKTEEAEDTKVLPLEEEESEDGEPQENDEAAAK